MYINRRKRAEEDLEDLRAMHFEENSHKQEKTSLHRLS